MWVGESFLDVVREHVGYILSDATKDSHGKLKAVSWAMVMETAMALEKMRKLLRLFLHLPILHPCKISLFITKAF